MTNEVINPASCQTDVMCRYLSNYDRSTKKNSFLDFAKTDFECPNCNAKYSDADDKYLKRCEKNKSWTTKINCKCGKPFYMTYDYKGDAVSFV